MTNIPSVPEIITVNSEALQTQIRDLLPSQNGFGSELQASNIITPIIDLTAAAEGSGLPVSLQQSMAFSSQTAFDQISGTATLVNSPGFYRVYAGLSCQAGGGTAQEISFAIDDSSTSKNIFRYGSFGASGSGFVATTVDFIVFLRAGDTLSVIVDAQCRASGSTRQVATGDGTLVQPTGFPL